MTATLRRPLVVLTLSAFALPAIASTIRDDRTALQYETLSNLPQYASVGQLGGGSGTLISSQWVITAAHVIGNGGTANFALGGANYPIVDTIQFSGWELGMDDFSLCRLATPVTSVAPAKLWNGGGELGKVGTSVGYGTTGTGLTGNVGGQARRAFQNVIDGLDRTDLELPSLSTDFDNPAGTLNSLGASSSATALDLEGCVAPGDSGGSLWANYGGVDYVVGVTSYVWWIDDSNGVHPPYGRYGDGSGYSRISTQAATDFIVQNTGIQPVPEPASLAGMALGALLILRRRRK